MLSRTTYLTIVSLLWAMPAMGAEINPLSSHQLYPVQRDGKWGYMDRAGRYVWQPMN